MALRSSYMSAGELRSKSPEARRALPHACRSATRATRHDAVARRVRRRGSFTLRSQGPGGTTDLAAAGVPESTIKKVGKWSSEQGSSLTAESIIIFSKAYRGLASLCCLFSLPVCPRRRIKGGRDRCPSRAWTMSALVPLAVPLRAPGLYHTGGGNLKGLCPSA